MKACPAVKARLRLHGGDDRASLRAPPRSVADTSLPRARQELTPSVSDQVSLTLLRPPLWAPLPLSPLGGGLVLFV